MTQHVNIRHVVGMFVMAAFAACLLVFTGIANLNLLQSVYPDPQFVAFGMVSLEGGIAVWLIMYFLSHSQLHKGISIVGLAMDTILSSVGFMFELAHVTHTAMLVNMPIIYVIGVAILFNVGTSLCWKLIPGNHANKNLQTYYQPEYTIEPANKNLQPQLAANSLQQSAQIEAPKSNAGRKRTRAEYVKHAQAVQNGEAEASRQMKEYIEQHPEGK